MQFFTGNKISDEFKISVKSIDVPFIAYTKFLDTNMS